MRRSPEKNFWVRFIGSVDDRNVGALLETLDDLRLRFQKFVVQIPMNTHA